MSIALSVDPLAVRRTSGTAVRGTAQNVSPGGADPVSKAAQTRRNVESR
ncbi:hypothetical protein [Streptomyces sp. NBC_01235]|nr:hypothetical protein OG289_12875 [Streptomyces sp. NBC_01235]